MFRSKIIQFLIASMTVSFSTVYANIDSFEIDISPKQAKVGDAVDITIKALDASGNVFRDYAWDILIFSDTDLRAEFPWVLSDNTYKFKTTDQWVVKFENAVKFSQSWKQFINVYDSANEDVFGIGEITISTTDVASVSNTEIVINNPSSGTTIGNSTIKVTGKTEKNYAVEITLNASEKFETISNGEWMFDVEITGLESWQNSLVATILDAEGTIIGTSQEVIVNFDDLVPLIRSIKTTPENTIEAESSFDIEITSNPWLNEVKVILDDFIQTLQEWPAGTYKASLTAPKIEGNYKIDVILINEIGTETEIKAAKEILITPIPQNAADEPVVELTCEELAQDLEVKNPKVVKMKSKSVITWDETQKAASYNVYKKNRTSWELELVENVTQPKIEINIVWDVVEYDDFVIKAVLDDGKCNIESPNSAEMTQVQTWPKEILLLILAVLATAFILRRKNANA